jgi:hypothetical protein
MTIVGSLRQKKILPFFCYSSRSVKAGSPAAAVKVLEIHNKTSTILEVPSSDMQKSSLDIRHDFHQHGMVLLYFVVVVRSSQTTLATPFIPFHNSKSLNCCDL